MKKVFLLITVICLVILLSYAYAADTNIKIYFEGSRASSARTAFLSKNTVMIPLDTLPNLLSAYNIKTDNDGFVSIDEIRLSTPYNVIWNADRHIVSISKNALLRVHFFDCGQADSTFIELPSGKCMLIDAGDPDFGRKLVSHIKKLGYKSLDYVIATHPHIDHIGGMPELLKSFHADKFMLPCISHTTKTYEKMIAALKKNGSTISFIESGDCFYDEDVTFTVEAPKRLDYDKMNNCSAVLRLVYKNNSYLFSADAEYESEADMLNTKSSLRADVLKVGHHGSYFSSSMEYLRAVSPQYAVISVGRSNLYGFPSSLVLARLNTLGIKTYRTDRDGTVNSQSDGYFLTIQSK